MTTLALHCTNPDCPEYHRRKEGEIPPNMPPLTPLCGTCGRQVYEVPEVPE